MESSVNSSKIEYKKKTPTKKVDRGPGRSVQRLQVRRVQVAQQGRTPLFEDIRNRSRGKYTAKEMAAEEVPDKVRKADAARYRAHSKMERTERELREWILDDPGPRSTVTEQTFHPVITVKLTPNPAERSGVTAPRSIRGCGRGGSCLRDGHLSPMQVLLL